MLAGRDVGTLVGRDVGKPLGIDVGTLVGMDVGTLVGTLVGRLVGSDVGVGVGLAVLGADDTPADVDEVGRLAGVLVAVGVPAARVAFDGAGVLAVRDRVRSLLAPPAGFDEAGAGSIGASANPWGEITLPVAIRTAIWRTMASSGRRIVTPTMAMVTQTAPPAAPSTMPGVRLARFSSTSSRSGTCWDASTICSPANPGLMSSYISA
ncbi:MAG TPA: hypothetical protein VMG38_26165 [Trebonia sp.]|nr:hypothetical protein [Trebonia sp.]